MNPDSVVGRLWGQASRDKAPSWDRIMGWDGMYRIGREPDRGFTRKRGASAAPNGEAAGVVGRWLRNGWVRGHLPIMKKSNEASGL